MMRPKEQASQLRLEIQRRQEIIGAILRRVQGTMPMIVGSVYARKRRCGKPQCHCARGRAHRDRVLAARREGRVTVRSIDPMEDAAIEEAVINWRLFRRDRIELTRTFRELLRKVDGLGRLRQLNRENVR